MTRRDLIQKVVIGGATLILAPQVIESCSKDSNPIDGGTGGNDLVLDLTDPKYSALNTVGGSATVQGIIIANTSGGYVALASNCTHQGCAIGYSSGANNFPCPCHGSVFSTSGSVINGPALVALRSYQVTKSGDTLTIIL